MSVCLILKWTSDHVVQNLGAPDYFDVEQYNSHDMISFPPNASSLPRQAWSFLSHLPVLEVGMSVKGWWEENQEQTERPLPAAGANPREESSWLNVHADQEYVLHVLLRRINTGQQRVSTLCSTLILSFLSSHYEVSF